MVSAAFQMCFVGKTTSLTAGSGCELTLDRPMLLWVKGGRQGPKIRRPLYPPDTGHAPCPKSANNGSEAASCSPLDTG